MSLDTHSLHDMLASARHASDEFRHSPQQRKPTLTFYGGADVSTGGRYLVATSAARILVDCGLVAGAETAGRRNWPPRPRELRGLDAIVLTSAGSGQCGYLAALAAEGWQGPIFTPAELVLEADVTRVGALLRPVEFGETVDLADGARLEFGRSGYQPGSAWARLEFDGQTSFVCTPTSAV